jgi:hypothetical protein
MKNNEVTTAKALLDVACGAPVVVVVILVFVIAMRLRSVEAQKQMLM